jgi:hypothetical protein
VALGHPDVSVIGSTDLARTAAFFSIFGSHPERLPDIGSAAAEALYGLEGPLAQWALVTPFAPHHRLVLVLTPNSPEPFAPLVAGAYGLDYFSTDLDLTLELAAGAGATGISPVVSYGEEPTINADRVGTYRNSEARFVGPDEISIFVTNVHNSHSAGYPTLLQERPEMMHSEMLQLCWVSAEIDRDLDFWLEEAGFQLLGDGFPESSEMANLMAHPRVTPLRDLAITAQGSVVNKTKIELMGYPQETVTRRADWPLRGGLHAAGFTVEDDLEVVIKSLPSASFGEVVTTDRGHGPQRAVRATSPDGLRFELWQAAKGNQQ